MSNFSKQAIWLAVNSEHGSRLVEIAKEHNNLACGLVLNRDHYSEADREAMKEKIEQLRIERDGIIAQFEGR